MKTVPVAKFQDKQKKHVSLFADKRYTDKSIPHSHNHYELEMIVNGKGETVLNGEKIRLVRGSVYLVRPSDIHSLDAAKNHCFEIMNISFLEGAFFNELSTSVLFGANSNIAVLSEDVIQNVLAVFNVMECEQHRRNPDSDIMRGCADVIIRLVMREIKWDHSKIKQDAFSRSLHFIADNFRDRIDLVTVAGYVGFTPQYFSKIFHQRMGKSFKKYLAELRIMYAAKLMKYNGFNSTQACFECGYNSYSAFVKAFKEYAGVLPRNYMMYKDEMLK